jgi:hypothetical protein
VNVFDLDAALVRDYERFARSFTRIRAEDIQEQVEVLYSSDRFWPEPLLSINPRFEAGDSVDHLVHGGTLHEATAKVFSVDGKSLTLHRHQAQAVAKVSLLPVRVLASRYAFLFRSSTRRSELAQLEKNRGPVPSSFIQ